MYQIKEDNYQIIHITTHCVLSGFEYYHCQNITTHLLQIVLIIAFLTLGIDFNASEFEFSEDLLLNRNDQQNGENGQSSTVRRLNSLPPIQFKNTLRAARKRDRSPSPVPVLDMIPKVV